VGVTPSNFVKLFDADKTRMIGYPKGERKKEKDMLTAKSHNINSKYQKWDLQDRSLQLGLVAYKTKTKTKIRFCWSETGLVTRPRSQTTSLENGAV